MCDLVAVVIVVLAASALGPAAQRQRQTAMARMPAAELAQARRDEREEPAEYWLTRNQIFRDHIFPPPALNFLLTTPKVRLPENYRLLWSIYGHGILDEVLDELTGSLLRPEHGPQPAARELLLYHPGELPPAIFDCIHEQMVWSGFPITQQDLLHAWQSIRIKSNLEASKISGAMREQIFQDLLGHALRLTKKPDEFWLYCSIINGRQVPDYFIGLRGQAVQMYQDIRNEYPNRFCARCRSLLVDPADQYCEEHAADEPCCLKALALASE